MNTRERTKSGGSRRHQVQAQFHRPETTQRADDATGTVLLRESSQEWQSGFEVLLHGSRAKRAESLPRRLATRGIHASASGPGRMVNPAANVSASRIPYVPDLDVSGNFYPAACFEPTIPALRVYSEGTSTRIFYDHIVSFQGHYLARQIQVLVSGKLAADINLNDDESLKQSPDTVLTAPSTALPVDRTKIMFKDDGARSHWPATLRKAVPVYPQDAKSMRIQGTVTSGHYRAGWPHRKHESYRRSPCDCAKRHWMLSNSGSIGHST